MKSIEYSCRFLEKYGERIKYIEDIKEGDLLGIIDIIGGFYIFKNKGMEKGLLPGTYFFKDPGVLYCVNIMENCRIDTESESWGLAHEGGWSRRSKINIRTLEEGIFKITSEKLIKRINTITSDKDKKTTLR